MGPGLPTNRVFPRLTLQRRDVTAKVRRLITQHTQYFLLDIKSQPPCTVAPCDFVPPPAT